MDNTDALTEQPIAANEAEALLPLSAEAGWNQTANDWRFMLANGRAFGVRGVASARWIGSALELPLGDALSWVSMVLVARDCRRRGIGTRLLRHSIDAARARGAAAGLDATELGRSVYLPLGFRDLYAISRWHLDGSRVEPAPSSLILRPLMPADVPAVIAFDTPRSGMARDPALRYLAGHAPQQAFIAERAGRMAGYALGRPGRVAPQIGPVVAEDEAAALALVAHALAAIVGHAMIDVPDAHRELSGWLKAQGAVRQRGFVRMVLGEPATALDNPRNIFALAGPELG